MLFALICTDKPGHLELRLSTRPAHIAYLDSQVAAILRAGAMLDDDGKPIGSLLLIDVADRAAAQAFAAADPFSEAGVFERVEIHPYRVAYSDGARLS